MIAPARCAVCNQQVYRDRYGKILMHTRAGKAISILAVEPIVCEGSDREARP